MEILPPNNNDQEIELICEFLNEQLGFTYGIQKKYLIIARLQKRLAELKVHSYQAYLELIKSDSSEMEHFFDLLTTNVTSFFREDSQFQILQQELRTSLIKASEGTNRLRCWSAGCSSGEEAYTLAIVLQEVLGDFWNLRILASDISVRKLAEGMAGIYSADKLSEVPADLRAKYFNTNYKKGYFKVTPELRRKVIFRKINLNQSFEIPPNIQFDLILCRNVFIYLAMEARQRVLDGFYHYLKKDGYLFLGQSEPISIFPDSQWLLVKNCIYQKK